MAPRERFELPRDGPTRFPVERNTRLCDLVSYLAVSHFMFNNLASTTSTNYREHSIQWSVLLPYVLFLRHIGNSLDFDKLCVKRNKITNPNIESYDRRDLACYNHGRGAGCRCRPRHPLYPARKTSRYRTQHIDSRKISICENGKYHQKRVDISI